MDGTMDGRLHTFNHNSRNRKRSSIAGYRNLSGRAAWRIAEETICSGLHGNLELVGTGNEVVEGKMQIVCRIAKKTKPSSPQRAPWPLAIGSIVVLPSASEIAQWPPQEFVGDEPEGY